MIQSLELGETVFSPKIACDLFVTFTNGETYMYQKVLGEDIIALIDAESIGKKFKSIKTYKFYSLGIRSPETSEEPERYNRLRKNFELTELDCRAVALSFTLLIAGVATFTDAWVLDTFATLILSKGELPECKTQSEAKFACLRYWVENKVTREQIAEASDYLASKIKECL